MRCGIKKGARLCSFRAKEYHKLDISRRAKTPCWFDSKLRSGGHAFGCPTIIPQLGAFVKRAKVTKVCVNFREKKQPFKISRIFLANFAHFYRDISSCDIVSYHPNEKRQFLVGLDLFRWVLPGRGWTGLLCAFLP